jgi:hypothetical protein
MAVMVELSIQRWAGKPGSTLVDELKMAASS